jgi:hypothetical protein
MELENLMPRVEIVRNIFIFSCYTGLAYIDVKKLSTENISLELKADFGSILKDKKQK